jgi:hypothetical protein
LKDHGEHTVNTAFGHIIGWSHHRLGLPI